MKQYGKETQTVYMVKKKVDCIICDVCGKSLYPRKRLTDGDTKYYEVTTGHKDWGADSIESRMHHDICVDCLPGFITDYVRHNKRTNTDYVEIDAKIFTDFEFDEVTVTE